LHVVATHPHGAGTKVDLDLTVAVVIVETGGGGLTPEQGVNSCHEFLVTERLGDVVVGAALQAANLLGFQTAGREYEHRDVADIADPLQDFPAIHAGQPDVENHQIGMGFVQGPQTDKTVIGLQGGVSGEFHANSEEVSDIGIIFDDEYDGRRVLHQPSVSSMVMSNALQDVEPEASIRHRLCPNEC
jgi:hypothetical protein